MYYRWSSRELRRLDCATRSPVLSIFAESSRGLQVLRAFGASQRTASRFQSAVRLNARAYFASWCANQWVTCVLEPVYRWWATSAIWIQAYLRLAAMFCSTNRCRT